MVNCLCWSSIQDVELEKKFITRPGELKLKQKVPAGRIFLVPSPELWVRAELFIQTLTPTVCLHLSLVKTALPFLPPQLKMTPVKNSNVTMEMEPSYSLLDRKCR